jgi:hypothetical protein
MEEYPLYYDWNTGQALQPWAWLLEDEEDDEWEFLANSAGTDYHLDLMSMDSYVESRRKSIRLPSVDKTQKSVRKPVDKLSKNRKIVINKNK